MLNTGVAKLKFNGCKHLGVVGIGAHHQLEEFHADAPELFHLNLTHNDAIVRQTIINATKLVPGSPDSSHWRWPESIKIEELTRKFQCEIFVESSSRYGLRLQFKQSDFNKIKLHKLNEKLQNYNEVAQSYYDSKTRVALL